VKPSFEEVLINVASTRIDAIIGEVFHLSRDAAKSGIEKGNLLLNGVAKDSASYLCLGGELVVLKGYGKFVYLGEVGTSRKGRVLAKIKRYR
jgi:RNA-binding protein YlmH